MMIFMYYFFHKKFLYIQILIFKKFGILKNLRKKFIYFYNYTKKIFISSNYKKNNLEKILIFSELQW